MAQELAIAKAALSASLFRADPTSLTRPAVEAFFPLLGTTLTQCSRPNVQKCKTWIVDNIAPSRTRTAALARYMAALSKSMDDRDGKKKPSARRQRLHVLYVIHDVVHHVVARLKDDKFGDAWEKHLPALVASAADFDNCPKHRKKLDDLIAIWEDKGYFAPSLLAQIRTAFTDGAAAAQAAAEAQPSTASVKLSKDAPFVLPSLHGDPSTPWYDLPAAAWLPHIVPNSTKPLQPDLIRPIQLVPRPGEKRLVAAVQDLLSDVERLFSKERKVEDEQPHVDLNELGERIVLDEITGDIISGETYYGWSRTFCEKMKERKKKVKGGGERGRSTSRSSSYGRGRSRSSSGPPAFKRRRGSSDSRSPRRHGRSRSYSGDRRRSRSRSPDQHSGRAYRRRSYSRSPSRSRSRSRPRHRNLSPSNRAHAMPPQPPPPSHPQFPPGPSPTNFPPPPPPPVGYHGVWPPPPPPPPITGIGGAQNWFPPNPGMIPPNMMAAGAWGGAPPPPPPPPAPAGPHHHQQQGHHFGRGGGDRFRGRGRGGYDRGRGW